MEDSLLTQTAELSIEGMSCDRCVARVEEALKEIPGVESVRVVIGHARVVYQPEIASRAEMGLRIHGLGYRIAATAGRRKGPLARWLDRLALSNAKTFGSGPLDCCTLGRKQPTGESGRREK